MQYIIYALRAITRNKAEVNMFSDAADVEIYRECYTYGPLYVATSKITQRFII